MTAPRQILETADVPTEWPVLQLVQNTAKSLTVELRDRSGAELTLSDETVTLDVREYESAAEAYFTVTGEVEDVSTVSVDVPAASLSYAGTWLGQFLISSGGSALYRIPCYVEVAPDLAANDKEYVPLSIAELRMLLRDRGAADNSLFEELEFSNTELALALRRPVDYWNESDPPLRGCTYTAATFPYRYHWADGAIGEVLRIAAHNLIRNRAPVKAGNLQMDRKSRAEAYAALADKYLQEYRRWVDTRKASISVRQCWGRVSNSAFEP